MREPGRSKPHLGVLEAQTWFTEDGPVPDLNPVEVDVRVSAVDVAVNRVDVTTNTHAWVVHRHQKHGRAGGRPPIVVRLGHHDAERGTNRAADEPLVTVDHPAISRATCCCPQRGGVRSGAWVRFGHRETGPDMAGCQRC